MKKKVAYVINRIERGGPSNVVLGIIHNLDHSQFEPVLVTLFCGNDETIVTELKEKGISVIECQNNSRMKYLLFGYRELKRIVNDRLIQVIHSHGFVPDIVSSRMHRKVRKINTIHNNMYEDYIFTYGKWKGFLYTRIHLRAMRKLDLCVCCSKTVQEVMQKRLKNVTYIRNGCGEIDTCTYESRETLGIPDGAVVFIYAGHFSPCKRTLQLVNHFHHFRQENEYLVMIGDGPEHKKCREVCDDHIKFPGVLKNPYPYMKMADIYVSESASEGFSVSILEALTCGLGLFLSDIPSHKEVFDISEETYLGEYFSENQFSEKLQSLRLNFSAIEKAKIKDFKRKYLLDSNMAKQYQMLY